MGEWGTTSSSRNWRASDDRQLTDNSGFVASGKSGTKLYLASQALEVGED